MSDEDLSEHAPLFEDLGLEGAGILWRRLYLPHPDSRALEGVRRTDPGADIHGLLRTVMEREEEMSRGRHLLRPRVLAHLVSEGLDPEVSFLVIRKGRQGPLSLFDAAAATALPSRAGSSPGRGGTGPMR